MRSIGQDRAANALARIDELNEHCDDFKKRYRSYLDRLGPAIVMNGLGQALATERAAAGATPNDADEKAHHELYKSLHQWLCRTEGGVYPSGEDLLQSVMENGETLYLRAQAEALAWLEWHKKCCRATFPRAEGVGE